MTMPLPDVNELRPSTYFQQIRKYNEVFESPTVESKGLGALELGKSLIEEEVLNELLPALAKYRLAPTTENLVPLADGICDGVVVLLFLAHQLGLPFDRCWSHVQGTQWAKLWPDGKVHRQGPTDPQPNKIIKPPGWQEPEAGLWTILEDHFSRKTEAKQEANPMQQGSDSARSNKEKMLAKRQWYTSGMSPQVTTAQWDELVAHGMLREDFIDTINAVTIDEALHLMDLKLRSTAPQVESGWESKPATNPPVDPLP